MAADIDRAAPAPASTKLILRRLWADWLAPMRALILLILLLMVIVAATGAAYPALIQTVFDGLAGTSERISLQELFWLVPLAIILLASIKAAAMYFQVLAVNRLALRAGTAIQKAMADQLIEADLAVLGEEPAGSYVSRMMNDVILVREAILRLANNLVRDLLTVAAMVAMMFWFDWLLSLVVLAVYPLAMRPVIAIGKRQRAASGALQAEMAGAVALLTEILQGIRLIKAFRMEQAQSRRAANSFEALFERLFVLTAGRARIDPILEVLGGVAIAGVVALAAWQVSRGEMAVGDVAGFVTALLMLVQPVRAIGTLNAVVQEGVAAAARIFDLLDRQPEIGEVAAAAELKISGASIRFEKVSLSYAGQQVLREVSFSVESGQTVALVGPSGAGKTSLVNLLLRFWEPQAGGILIDDQDIASVKLASLRQNLALVSQESVLFDDTVAANIGFGNPEAGEAEIHAAAKAAAADGFITQLPGGYQAACGPSGQLLSGGQRQRIAIARAILKQAPILLLDEATSALDAEAEDQIRDALFRLQKGRTTLIVAHRLSTIQKADRILVLEGGELVETGTHAALIKRDGLYARLCALQHFAD